jgi:hypothetical protein
METITETKKLFSNLNDLLNCVDYQLTAQQLINKRVYLKGEGWSNIELTTELKDYICSQIVEILGGRQATKQSIKNTLLYSTPQHWGLDRIHVDRYSDNFIKISYCAGQDHTLETNTIRKFLK